jgi:hypothetical protein
MSSFENFKGDIVNICEYYTQEANVPHRDVVSFLMATAAWFSRGHLSKAAFMEVAEGGFDEANDTKDLS